MLPASGQTPSPNPSTSGPPRSVAAYNWNVSTSAVSYCLRKTTGAFTPAASSTMQAVRRSTMACGLSVSNTTTDPKSDFSLSKRSGCSMSSAREVRTKRTAASAPPPARNSFPVMSGAWRSRGAQSSKSRITPKVPGSSKFTSSCPTYTQSHAASSRFHLSSGTLYLYPHPYNFAAVTGPSMECTTTGTCFPPMLPTSRVARR